MAVGDVNITLTDGGVGRTPRGADGIHLKIGVAEGGEANTVYEANSYYDAKRILKKGPLLDAIKVYFNEFSKSKKQEPVKMLFARAESGVPGSILPVIHTGTGIATTATSGTVTGSRDFVLEVVSGGASGTATYRKAFDGGLTFSEVTMTPASKAKISLGAGVSIAFTDDSTTPANSFVTGDRYTFSSQAPTASNLNLLTCVHAARQNHEAKFVHIMGETDKAFWTSIGQIINDWESHYHDHKAFIVETASRGDSQAVSDWVEERINETIGFYHNRIVVCPIQVTSTLLSRDINSAWILSAKMASARVHESPGYVDSFAFLTVSSIKDSRELLEKDDEGSSYLDKLDNKRLTVAAVYENYPGIYFSHVNLLSKAQSDFKRAQDIRPADKVRRIVRQAIIKFLESPAHKDTGGGGIDSLIVTIDNEIANKMEIQGDIEIAGHETDIDPDQDVVTTGKVTGNITIQSVGTMEKIELDVSYEA